MKIMDESGRERDSKIKSEETTEEDKKKLTDIQECCRYCVLLFNNEHKFKSNFLLGFLITEELVYRHSLVFPSDPKKKYHWKYGSTFVIISQLSSCVSEKKDQNAKNSGSL